MAIFTLVVGKHKAKFMPVGNSFMVISKNNEKFYFSTLGRVIEFIKNNC